MACTLILWFYLPQIAHFHILTCFGYLITASLFMWRTETLTQPHLFRFWKFHMFSTRLIAYPYSTRGIYITGVVNGCRIHWWSQQSAKEEWGCTGVRFKGYSSKVTSSYWTGNRDTMCVNERVVKKLKVGEMIRLLYIVFILDSRIIHFVFGEVCQLFC